MSAIQLVQGYLWGSDGYVLTNKYSFYLSVMVNTTEVAPNYIQAEDLLSMDEILQLESVHF